MNHSSAMSAPLGRTSVGTYLLCLAAGLAVAFLIAELTPVLRIGADDFMPARLYHDLVVDGGAWSAWHLPPAPYYFPDLALYFLILSIGVPLMWIATVYAFAIAASTCLAAYWLGTLVFRERATALVVALGLMTVLILAGEQHTFWNRPIFHYGVFVNALLVLGLIVTAALRRRALFLLPALIVVEVMSDFLFIPVIAASVTGCVLTLWLCGVARLRDCVLIVGVAGFAVVLGYYLQFQFTPNVSARPAIWASGLHLKYGLLNPLSHWIGLRFAIVKLWSPFYGVVGGLVVVIAVVIWRDRKLRNSLVVISGFFVSGIVANLYVVGLDTDPGAFTRYSIFATDGTLAYGVFCLGFIALRWTWIKNVVPVAIVLAAIAMMWVGEQGKSLDRPTGMLATRDCLVRVSEREGLTYGLASYSNANRFTVLTDFRLKLAPVRGDSLDFLPWISSEAWLQHTPSFVLADRSVSPSVYEHRRLGYPLSEEIVLRTAGKPSRRYQCGTLLVMIYANGTID